MWFTQEDLAEAFNQAYYKRGRSYFNQGKVLEHHIIIDTSDKTIFESKVKGSGYGAYTQKSVLKKDRFGLNVSGYCSCPVSYNCKHVVAACLHYQKTTGLVNAEVSQASEMPLSWLETFAQSFEERPLESDLDKKFLVYVLRKDKDTEQTVVNFYITKFLKKGGLSKGSAISFSSLKNALFYPPAYLQEKDIEILGLLKSGSNHICGLKGALGFVAMQEMLATGRCFWNDFHSKPLVLGEVRDLVQQWGYNDLNQAQLHVEVQPPALLLLTEPALYLDTIAYKVGTLNNCFYNAKQLNMLINAPVVPAELIDDFSQQIALSMPESVLLPPKAVAINEVVNQKPIPQLLLYREETEMYRARLGCLRFSYAGNHLSVLPEDTIRKVVQDNSIVSIHRDMEEEQRYMTDLQVFGLEGGFVEGEKDLYVFFEADSAFEDDALWGTFISNHVPALQQKGWHIDIDDSFNMQLHQAENWHVDIEEQGSDWFDLRFDINVNGQKQALLPLIAQVLQYYEPNTLPDTLTLNLGDGQYLNLASEQLKPVLEILYELYDNQSLTDDGALTMSRFDAGRLSDLEQENNNLIWSGGENLREIGKRLNDFEGIEVVAPPQGLKVELRNYQQQGLNWLQFLRSYHLNGILADDMGLGKTVQTLAHLLLEKEQGRMNKPCLIIAPTSLMSNWRREAEAFAPELKVLVLQGAERKQHFESIQAYDLILSTYPLLVRDEAVLMQHEYHMLVLDEAQVIKNPKAKASKVVRRLKATHKLCLTGTPMENHLGELWALFDFLMPGFLGDMKQFNKLFRTPIETQGDLEQQQRLTGRIRPFMLRRTKSAVAAELPEKTEMLRTVSLGKKQAALYESIRISMEKKVRETIADKGLARSHITILDALLKLRQVCCDPRILSLKQAKKVEESAKLELLMQMLPEMIEEGRKVLLFSQFTKMLGLIEKELKSRSIRYSKLTGQTRKRDDVIDKFKRGEADVFLISLKAGGVGLNLTEADTVIHYDPWWNPAAENQATDRAHRIGQEKAVFVYKLVVENSVEEKIIAMQDKKKGLADMVYQKGNKQDELKLEASDFQDLFAPL